MYSITSINVLYYFVLGQKPPNMFEKLDICVVCEGCPIQKVQEEAMDNMNADCSECVRNCYFPREGNTYDISAHS